MSEASDKSPYCKDIGRDKYYEWEITEYIDSKYCFPYGNLMEDFIWRDMKHFMSTRGTEWLYWKMITQERRMANV